MNETVFLTFQIQFIRTNLAEKADPFRVNPKVSFPYSNSGRTKSGISICVLTTYLWGRLFISQYVNFAYEHAFKEIFGILDQIPEEYVKLFTRILEISGEEAQLEKVATKNGNAHKDSIITIWQVLAAGAAGRRLRVLLHDGFTPGGPGLIF